MQRRALGRKKVATTAATMELSPGATAGMAMRADVAETSPAARATIGVGTKMVRGVDLTAAPPEGDEPWWRGAGRLMAPGDVLRTGVTVGLTGEPGKRLGDLRGFSRWWDGGRWFSG